MSDGVAVIVVRPIGHRPQRRAGREHVGLGEHRHQSNEPAVAAAIKADLLRVHALRRHQVSRRIHDVVQVLAAHVLVDRGAPVAPISGRAAVIHVDHGEAALHQQVMEHVLAVVIRPPAVDVLQIARAVHEDHARTAAAEIRGLKSRAGTIAPSRAVNVTMGASCHGYCQKSGAGDDGQLLRGRARACFLHVELGRLVGVGVNVGDPAFVGRTRGTNDRRGAW